VAHSPWVWPSIRTLLFASRMRLRDEGVVKRHHYAAMLFCTASISELAENRSSGHLTVNRIPVESFHQPSIRPFTSAMILLSESQFALGRERAINPLVYPPRRTTRAARQSKRYCGRNERRSSWRSAKSFTPAPLHPRLDWLT